jgi:hypothetical protein
MIPRTMLPNVYMDYFGLEVVFQMSGWELVVIMIALVLITAGIVIFSYETSIKTLKKGYDEKFAKATKEYTDDVINTSFIEKGTFYKGDKYSIKKIKTLLEDYGYTVTKLKGKK